MLGPYLARPMRHSSLDVFLNKFGLIRVGLEVFWRPIFSLVVVGLCIGPKARSLTWEFYPYMCHHQKSDEKKIANLGYFLIIIII